jgi:tetratricopeptide (TPR) repeat protein
MSENIGNTQPQPPFDAGSTQPLKPVKKAPRWRSIVLSGLGVIALVGLGSMSGYWGGIGIRKSTEESIRSKQLTEQFQYALVDEQFGRYDAAQQRLEFIIQHDPMFPGAQNELAKVLVQSTVPTAVPTATITPTPDVRGEEGMFATAQQLIATGDWGNAIAQLDQLRKADPGYKTPQIDGMYYFALRNYGVNLIQQQGNLEGGIYQLTLAERFAPLDNTANALREGARAYIQASSFFGVDWRQSVATFAQVATGWPSLWDGTMTANQRYHEALMRYGDQLWAEQDACGAYTQYHTADGIANLDATAAKNANQAFQACYPATPTVAIATAAPTQSTSEPPTAQPPTAEPPTAVPPSPTP